uniref:Cytochrome P450 n=1 Tax=Leersia perrieri TaxID=77586 RepID=A0A0D9X3I0_9ORYZ
MVMELNEATSSIIFFFLLPLALLLLLLHQFTRSTRSSQGDQTHSNNLLNKLPSPPWKLPVIGHMHLIGSLPYISLRDLAVNHGPDLMLIHLGAVPTLVVSSPRAAEAVLRTHDLAFASRPRSMVTDIILYGASDSCFAPYGDHFRNVRKMVTVHLLHAKKVQAYRPARQEEVSIVIDKLRKAAMSAATVDMSEILHSSNDLICRAVSGKFFRKEGRNRLFRELIDTNGALLGGFNLENYFPGLARMKLVSKIICARAMRVRSKWDELLDKLIDDHVANKLLLAHDREENEEHQDDSAFIDVLLSRQEEYGFTRDHIKAILLGMFEAGTDTSYLVLESAMVELIRNPDVLAKLQDEVRTLVRRGQDMVTEDDIIDMVYLKAVIKETLRIHPPAGLNIPHLTREDCEVNGYMIPTGTRVIINLWALNMHVDFWDKPDEFLPGRFMDVDNKRTIIDFKGKDFQFVPFGSGRRMCPGIHTATATIEIMLANLVYCFNWKLPAGLKKEDIDMTKVFGLTVHRKEKLF